ANRFQVFAQLVAVATSELGFQAVNASRHVVEDAALLPYVLQARRRLGAVPVAEQTLKHRARVHFHRHRSSRRSPGKRVRVRAAISGVAAPGQRRSLQAKFERSQLRALTELLSRKLVRRDARADSCPLGLLRVNTGQPGGALTSMIARPVPQ